MSNTQSFHIASFAGDGIGPEIIEPTLELMRLAAGRAGGLDLSCTPAHAGAAVYASTGNALPKEALDTAKKADAILLAAMGDPAIRYSDGTEISPQIDIRFELGLYAGVRPVRSIPGVRTTLADPRAADMDFVILRESTEGLFASHGKGEVSENEARETLLITRDVSEKLHRFGLDLGRTKSEWNRVSCVDKANVFKAFAFFREIFDEEAKAYSDLTTDHIYIDACALLMVQRPWELGVLITENMFGDILSDLGAGLIGGMGYAPSADIGDSDAVFQPCHGSAPDIAGKGLANPTAMILSAAMMLEWLGQEHNAPEAKAAGGLLRDAVDAAFAPGDLVTCELGGSAGTKDVITRVKEALLA